MSRTRVPGDGPKCQCGAPAVWSGYCQMQDGRGYCGNAGAAQQAKPAPLPWDEGGRDAYYSKLPGDTRLVAGLDPEPELRSAPSTREARRLNPYKDPYAKRPDGALELFLFGIRYYAGMLEDDGNWSHALGHIEECCKEFQEAIDARAGRAKPELLQTSTQELIATVRKLSLQPRLQPRLTPMASVEINAALAELEKRVGEKP